MIEQREHNKHGIKCLEKIICLRKSKDNVEKNQCLVPWEKLVGQTDTLSVMLLHKRRQKSIIIAHTM